MNKREVLLVLNKLKNIAEKDDIEAKLELTQLEVSVLHKYLLELKRYHEKDVELIDEVYYLIQKNRGV